VAAVGSDEAPLRARLQARLARALLFTPQLDRHIQLAQEATALARQLDDPSTLAAVLYERHQAIWFTDSPESRLAMMDEVVQLVS